jgi:[protein-PII] uridylyltransferase
LEKSYDFMLRTRAAMQYINGRLADVLTLQLQGRVANEFNYPQKNILRKVEAFMRDD